MQPLVRWLLLAPSGYEQFITSRKLNLLHNVKLSDKLTNHASMLYYILSSVAALAKPQTKEVIIQCTTACVHTW